jgi:hypothetical protein
MYILILKIYLHPTSSTPTLISSRHPPQPPPIRQNHIPTQIRPRPTRQVKRRTRDILLRPRPLKRTQVRTQSSFYRGIPIFERWILRRHFAGEETRRYGVDADFVGCEGCGEEFDEVGGGGFGGGVGVAGCYLAGIACYGTRDYYA